MFRVCLLIFITAANALISRSVGIIAGWSKTANEVLYRSCIIKCFIISKSLHFKNKKHYSVKWNRSWNSQKYYKTHESGLKRNVIDNKIGVENNFATNERIVYAEDHYT